VSILFQILSEEERRAPAALYEEARWYACHARSRHEKRIAQGLRDKGIEGYLPIVERESQWKHRRKRVAWPLFAGYVFARFRLGELGRVLAVPGVATVVRARGYPTPIPDAEIENIRQFAEALARTGEMPETVPFLEVGRRVRVMDGPFEGIEGIVTESRKRSRVRVGLSAIGRALEVDIATHLLQRLPA
jgi:transcription antitermination factor NusG